jgi:hypothetical protein
MKRLGTFLCAVMWALALTACQTSGNVSPTYDITASKNSGLVLFSVSHDKNKGLFLSRGANLQFSVDFRSVDSNIKIPVAFSNDPLVLVVTSAFDDDWGRVYVREFAAGRYELTGWSLKEYTGSSVRTIEPKQPPAPIAFEVLPDR